MNSKEFRDEMVEEAAHSFELQIEMYGLEEKNNMIKEIYTRITSTEEFMTSGKSFTEARNYAIQAAKEYYD
jgi:hypothetical protein